MSWANDWRTREFCDLGLHLLFEHHIHRGNDSSITQDVRLFRNLRPEDLTRHAAEVIKEADKAEALSKQRWSDTWGHQEAFTGDLIAYLFRPGPHIRRYQEIHPALCEMVPRLALGELIRQGAAAELESNLADPLVALATFVQAALPCHPAVRTYVLRLEDMSHRLWAELYACILSAYGVERRAGVEWLDIAELFDTVIDGILLRARSREAIPRLTNGDDVLSGAILAMLPALLDLDPSDIEHRRASTMPAATWLPASGR